MHGAGLRRARGVGRAEPGRRVGREVGRERVQGVGPYSARWAAMAAKALVVDELLAGDDAAVQVRGDLADGDDGVHGHAEVVAQLGEGGLRAGAALLAIDRDHDAGDWTLAVRRSRAMLSWIDLPEVITSSTMITRMPSCGVVLDEPSALAVLLLLLAVEKNRGVVALLGERDCGGDRERHALVRWPKEQVAGEAGAQHARGVGPPEARDGWRRCETGRR